MEDQKGYFIDNGIREPEACEPASAEIPGAGEPSSAETAAPFVSSKRELAAALLMYAAAYVYIDRIWFAVFTDWRILLFSGMFVLITETVCRGIPRSRESIVWLGCLALVTAGASYDPGLNSVVCCGADRPGLLNHSVWGIGHDILFMHLFGVWYALSRSGRLLEGESGHLLPADAIDGFVIFPFGNFFLRVRVVFCHVKNLFANSNKENGKRVLWCIAAVIPAFILLVNAVHLLTEADSAFGSLIERMRLSLKLDFNEDLGEIVLKFLLSFPVGAYLFGLLAGSVRTDAGLLERRRSLITLALEKLKRVPGRLWIAVIGVFSLFYLAFFFIQGEYLFAAFAGRLPEGFIVSQYARQGFFELCKVIAVNFSLLWLITRSTEISTKNSKALLISCIAFLGESMIFCVIAFSKLALYIHSFGFTPLRLQSSWLVCVLFSACVLWCVELLTDRKVFRTWMYIAGVSLSVLAVL